MHIFKFLKAVFLSIFCTCEDTKSTVYYTEIWPYIKVYREDVCKKCGHCSTILLAEYIHDLAERGEKPPSSKRSEGWR